MIIINFINLFNDLAISMSRNALTKTLTMRAFLREYLRLCMGGMLLLFPFKAFCQEFSEHSMADSGQTIPAENLYNEFSFHVIPIYQIFTGSPPAYHVLFQYRRLSRYANRAFVASLYFHEGVQDMEDSSCLLPKADSIFYYHTIRQTSYLGGMAGYEGFIPVNSRWRVFYGGNLLFFYGRVSKETYNYRFVKDSLSGFYRYTSDYKSRDSLTSRTKIFRPGLSLHGGVEYKFNPNFGLSLMTMNNIYYDLIEDVFPLSSRRQQFSFDLLRIYLMVNIYF